MKIRKAILLRNMCFAFAAAFLILVICVEAIHYRNYGHFVSYGFHVDVLEVDAYIGIPGQIKMYHAQISNYSLLPVSLPACNYASDVLTPQTELPYAVQRWDASSSRWQTVAGGEGDFCNPSPWSESTSKWLLPCMYVDVMGDEATGAREPFRKGDMARFVVFTKINGKVDWATSVASMPFYIQDDVIRDKNDSLRIKH